MAEKPRQPERKSPSSKGPETKSGPGPLKAKPSGDEPPPSKISRFTESKKPTKFVARDDE